MMAAWAPGVNACAWGKEKGNMAHQASGATTMTERGQCGGVLQQQRHFGGR
jgi:hypothetical protein